MNVADFVLGILFGLLLADSKTVKRAAKTVWGWIKSG